MGKIKIGLVFLTAGIIGAVGAYKLSLLRDAKYKASETTLSRGDWYMQDLFSDGNPIDEVALGLMSISSSLVGLEAIASGSYERIFKKK